jgi:pimeloyl-ACP methyl ester carboxylesterase
MPGFGDSARPAADDHAAIAQPLADGLQRLLGAGCPAPLVGFSFGGVVAAHLAALYPPLVRQLVIVDAGGLGTPQGPVRLAPLRGLDGDARRAAARTNLLAIMLRHPESVDDLALHVAAVNGARRRLSVEGLMLPDKLIRVLGRVTCPVAAIWGACDQLYGDAPVQEAALRSVQPACDFRVIPGAGHWAMYERPAAFDAALLDVLAKAR